MKGGFLSFDVANDTCTRVFLTWPKRDRKRGHVAHGGEEGTAEEIFRRMARLRHP